MLAQLTIWNDAQPHDGPTNMAIDDWLWHSSRVPTLRVYRWQGDWMSIGYFSASAMVPTGRAFVRRPTGGGMVDHRDDWTYTLVVPRSFAIAEMPGAESYRLIHQALCDVLREENIDCALVHDAADDGDGFCFQSPVVHDLIDATGRKLAGAGQRRGKLGLLHQGSLQVSETSCAHRAERLAAILAREVREEKLVPDIKWVFDRVERVYAHPAWNRKR